MRWRRRREPEKVPSYPCCAHCGPEANPEHIHFAPCTACQYDGEIYE